MIPERRGGDPLLRWRLEPAAWRVAPFVTRRRIDVVLRWRTAAGLRGGRDRFRAMGLPDDAVLETLRRVRSVAGWDVAWTWTAQRFLGEVRRPGGPASEVEAAIARRRAALCYHVAQFSAGDDPRKGRALRASATTIFAQSIPALRPLIERVEIPWRTACLPGFLVRPDAADRPAPLTVLLNGSSTAKEETVLWAGAFRDRGQAVLALDWPGTGEAGQRSGMTADCDDLTDGVVGVAAADPTLDEARVGLVGFGLGGALAVQAAAGDRRIAAVVAVTPPYDAARWLSGASPLQRQQLLGGSGEADALLGLAADFALPQAMRRLRTPLLVIGAGRDLVVPPDEAIRLAAAGGDLATLVWFPQAGHGLYEAIAEWTEDAATWLAAVSDDGTGGSTGVDPELPQVSLQETNRLAPNLFSDRAAPSLDA